MPIDRRSFLDEILAAAALSSLLPQNASAQAPARIPATPPPGTHDSINFWNDLYESHRGGAPKLAAPERQVRFVYHHPQKGFAFMQDIPKDSLLDHAGDVKVTLNMGQFRPAKSDQTAFKQLQSSSLRVDCVQTRPMMNLVAPLAWASLASLFPDKQGKLPSLQTLGFQNNNPGTDNIVLLPGGIGRMAVNISVVRKESMLHKILTEAQTIAGITAPFFAFPAISIPALKAITTIVSALEEHTSFLLNSPLIMTVATQQALDDESRDVTFLPLASGEYVLVPQAHADELGKNLDKLDMTGGYLVDKTAPSSQPPETRAANAVPDVTYVTLKVVVTAAQSTSAPASPPAAAAGSSDSSSSTSKAPAKGSSTTTKKKQ